VQGTYDDVNRLCSEIAENEDWAFVNVNVRPYYAEGSKTLGYEVAEQLGWRIPPQVVIPMASGSLLTKVDKAFGELTKLGLVDESPWKVYGAQATGCSPIATAFEHGWDAVKPSSRRPSPGRWPSATPPTAVRPRRRPPHRRRDGPRLRRAGRRGHPPARLDRGAVRRDRRRRHGRDAQQLLERGQIDPDAETVLYNTGDGPEDARRGGRRGRAHGDDHPVLRRLRRTGLA
jgi:threonine synthase